MNPNHTIDTKQAELELSVIRKIMDDSRRAVSESGKHYILWGVLVSVALISNYILLITKSKPQYIGLMWLILMVLGTFGAIYIAKKEDKKSKVKTYPGKLIGSLWISVGISNFILSFIGMAFKAYDPIYICAIISVTLGIGYFTSGAIQQVKWLSGMAFGWWSGAILLFAFPSIHSLLIFGLMLVFFQVIPGIILYKKWKNEIGSAL